LIETLNSKELSIRGSEKDLMRWMGSKAAQECNEVTPGMVNAA
jgi:hypothetical protein